MPRKAWLLAIAALLIPAIPAQAHLADPPPAQRTITVTSGDTLSGIAAMLGITWSALGGYNHIANPNAITPGQVLSLPPVGYSFDYPAAPPPTQHPYSSLIACIIARENGGSYGRSSNPTHFGRYQFSRSTWAAYGGNPATWGYASPAEQDAVFYRAMATPGGANNWRPYDGC